MNQTFELDYIKGQLTEDATVKLQSNMPFEGSRKIGLRTQGIYEQICTLSEAKALLTAQGAKLTVALPVAEIKYSWAP